MLWLLLGKPKNVDYSTWPLLRLFPRRVSTFHVVAIALVLRPLFDRRRILRLPMLHLRRWAIQNCLEALTGKDALSCFQKQVSFVIRRNSRLLHFFEPQIEWFDFSWKWWLRIRIREITWQLCSPFAQSKDPRVSPNAIRQISKTQQARQRHITPSTKLNTYTGIHYFSMKEADVLLCFTIENWTTWSFA